MRFRSLTLAAAIAGLAALPVQAQVAGPSCSASLGFTLGLGGSLTGCWGAFTATQLYENAGNWSDLYWFDGDPGQSGPINAPIAAGSEIFTDNGSTGTYPWPGAITAVIPWNSNGELVFGLFNLTAGGWGPQYWNYSGSQARNGIPAPSGYQAYLLKVDNSPNPWDFILAFEDLNSGCSSSSSATHVDYNMLFPATPASKVFLDTDLGQCTGGTPDGGIANGGSDRDYNDFYVYLSADPAGRPVEVVPEPVTMTLLGTGLVGLAGAQFRRRKGAKKS